MNIANNLQSPLVLPVNTKAPKNGYACIYLSNENVDAVYFDNFTVADNRGRIIEEGHYYSYGLKISGISSKKLPDPNEGNLQSLFIVHCSLFIVHCSLLICLILLLCFCN
jgi:hypothetical protein